MDRPMNMAQLAAFRFLGLTSDADEAAVRRAYAQRLKTCSPETDPQGWMRLHSAFKTALSVFELPASDRQGGGASPDEFDPEPQSGTEEDTFQSLFDNIEQLAGEADEEERQRYEAHAQELREAEDRKLQALCREVKGRVSRLVRRALFKHIEESDLQELFSCRAWRQIRETNAERLRPEIDRLLARNKHMSLGAIRLLAMESGTWQSVQRFFQEQQNASARKKSVQKKNRRILWWVLAAIFLFGVFVPSGLSGRTTTYNYTSPRVSPFVPHITPTIPQLNPIPRPQSSPTPAFDRAHPVSEVQNCVITVLVSDITLGECIAHYAEEDGTWSSEGERVAVSAGEGEREVYALFSLDSADSGEAVAVLHPVNRSEPLYVLAFRICGRNLRGSLDHIFFTMAFSYDPVESFEKLFRIFESQS